MATTLIDGKTLAASTRAALKDKVAQLAAKGARPGLAAVLVGNDPASRVYVRNKAKSCEETGLHSEVHELPADTSEKALLELVARLNRDPKIHGILVQLPLPKQINSDRVLAAISPAKDVDGFHAESLGALVQGLPGFVPCTPAGVMEMLAHAKVPLAGARAVIVGRSTIVGKPLALLLLQKDATVTICHSRTKDLAARTREADVLIAAVGKAKLITRDMVKPGACVIDVGINRLPDGKLAGDVDFDSVKEVAGSITPVPGGVGPMTIAMLIVNTVRSAERTLGKAAEQPAR
ncbi:MAG TPA: bifunctional methylenetetrahydrofolate dehydrogenase/methenyltetrahydrofolate cyclohydrolase FolD [Burkholderiales bacterium]|jgi:methylenetetrahydrofolate dehydrogenase (NADP+)/methenyltetrahydrofolate cyclohydrolase|nr:bifunctional methylenetetrahydrofolate dehydrogenase/methenyltetrahydrofolate cyclohydrolase FolD [Burkholderiales bacterium]